MEENAVKIIINDSDECTVGTFDGGKKYWCRLSTEPVNKIHVLVVESDHICNYYHGEYKIISEMLRAEGSNELADRVAGSQNDKLLLYDSGRDNLTVWPCDFKKPEKADLEEFIRYFWNGAEYRIADKGY
jgi:hypothetical protein